MKQIEYIVQLKVKEQYRRRDTWFKIGGILSSPLAVSET